MPTRGSSSNTTGFVHIGKTAGSTISTLLRNGCTSFVVGTCRNITHETAISRAVEHYYHVSDFFRLPETKHKSFIISVRDPFDRTISALLYHHPLNSKVYKLRQTKKQLVLGPQAYKCFPKLEDFAQLMNGSSTNCNYPYRFNNVVTEDCHGFACAALHGRVRFFSHLFFNYRNILYTKLPVEPTREMYVLRQEFLWSDWKAVNKIFGQTEPVVIPEHQNSENRNISGIELPVSREISLDGRHKLCVSLKSEYVAYLRILKKAINMNKLEFEESLHIARKRCPNLDFQSMARML